MRRARGRISSGRMRPVAILIIVLLLSGIMAASLWHRRGRDIAWAPDRVPRLGRSTATLAPGLHYLGRLFPSAFPLSRSPVVDERRRARLVKIPSHLKFVESGDAAAQNTKERFLHQVIGERIISAENSQIRSQLWGESFIDTPEYGFVHLSCL